MGKNKNHGKSGRKETKPNLPKKDRKYEDESPRKDYSDYRKDTPKIPKEQRPRTKKRYGEFTNADTNNLTILRARLKSMERITPAHRVQPDWDMMHEGLLQRVNGLTKLSKTVK